MILASINGKLNVEVVLECGRVADGFLIVTLMDGSSGIVDFIKVEEAQMMTDKFRDSIKVLDLLEDLEHSF